EAGSAGLHGIQHHRLHSHHGRSSGPAADEPERRAGASHDRYLQHHAQRLELPRRSLTAALPDATADYAAPAGRSERAQAGARCALLDTSHQGNGFHGRGSPRSRRLQPDSLERADGQQALSGGADWTGPASEPRGSAGALPAVSEAESGARTEEGERLSAIG